MHAFELPDAGQHRNCYGTAGARKVKAQDFKVTPLFCDSNNPYQMNEMLTP